MKAVSFATRVATVGVALILAAAVQPIAAAEVSGLAAMHDLRREGGRLCMDGHFHQGSSNGHATRRQAVRAAVESWSDFTNLEYGRTWSRFSRAKDKSMACSQTTVGWGCDVDARPCR